MYTSNQGLEALIKVLIKTTIIMAEYYCTVYETIVLLVMKFKQSQIINFTIFLDPYERQLPGKCISLLKKLGLVNIFFQLPKMKSRELWGIFKLRLIITS